MPLTLNEPAVIEVGSIGSEKVRLNVVGAVPVTIDPAAGLLEITVGVIAN